MLQHLPIPGNKQSQKSQYRRKCICGVRRTRKASEKTMAQLYDPDKMPKGLRQAHKDLDEAVERCYRLQPFENDTQRLEYLFKEYEKMVAKDTLFGEKKKRRKKKVE